MFPDECSSERLTITAAAAPTSNGCFEVSADSSGAAQWPPPSVTDKDYEAVVGELLWSKFNGQPRCTTNEQRTGIAERIEAMLEEK